MDQIDDLERRMEEIRQLLDDAMKELRALITQNNNNRHEDEVNAAVIMERERRLDRREDRMRRLEVPYFSGDDPYGWIYRAERYFEMNRIPEEEKDTSENPYEALMSLKQTDTVGEFIEQFELISALLSHADEDMLKGAFMNGLKDVVLVRAEVRLYGSEDLNSTMKLAKKVEEKNRVLGREGSVGPSKKLQGKKVMVLVDSGASHNFISQEWVQQLGIRVDQTLEYVVQVGDGVDVVLGYEWLENLGKIEADFKDHVMWVVVDGKSWGMLSMCSQEVKGVVAGLEEVLGEYQDLFQEAKGLPPQRRCDHAIVLKEGSQIPNMRPYRYPHQQKEAIETFVKDMLAAALIRPSVRPFASPKCCAKLPITL
ncbi:enzymatic polyprotein [Trifolium medium]|uniref:Enzymatic polyprotein n=1 Tax=Trifolium medium TaxID=97028 RepID=A0A392M1M9_9FABA|nr:enzymatic polyprotein [Trifolium medium]